MAGTLAYATGTLTIAVGAGGTGGATTGAGTKAAFVIDRGYFGCWWRRWWKGICYWRFRAVPGAQEGADRATAHPGGRVLAAAGAGGGGGSGCHDNAAPARPTILYDQSADLPRFGAGI